MRALRASGARRAVIPAFSVNGKGRRELSVEQWGVGQYAVAASPLATDPHPTVTSMALGSTTAWNENELTGSEGAREPSGHRGALAPTPIRGRGSYGSRALNVC